MRICMLKNTKFLVGPWGYSPISRSHPSAPSYETKKISIFAPLALIRGAFWLHHGTPPIGYGKVEVGGGIGPICSFNIGG